MLNIIVHTSMVVRFDFLHTPTSRRVTVLQNLDTVLLSSALLRWAPEGNRTLQQILWWDQRDWEHIWTRRPPGAAQVLTKTVLVALWKRQPLRARYGQVRRFDRFLIFTLWSWWRQKMRRSSPSPSPSKTWTSCTAQHVIFPIVQWRAALETNMTGPHK